MNHDCVFTTCDISGKLFDLSVPHFSSSVKWEKQWSRAHHIVLRFKWGRICKGHRQCSMCVTVYGWSMMAGVIEYPHIIIQGKDSFKNMLHA